MSKKFIAFIIIFICVGYIWNWKHPTTSSKNSNSSDRNNSGKADDAFEFVVTQKFDLDTLKSYKVPMILDFGSEGCQPCRAMAPALKEIYDTYTGKAIIKYSDVWANPSLDDGFPVQYIPSQFFFNSDGTPYVPKGKNSLNLEFVKNEKGEHILTKHVGMLSFEQMKSVLEEMGVDG